MSELLKFNIPASAQQWAKGAFWAFVGGASSVLMSGGSFDWHKALVTGGIAFFAYLHSSAPKA